MVKGFVLAGGGSSRFGSNKARHLVEGVPMASRVASALEQAGLQVCLVVRDLELSDLGHRLLCEDLDSGSPHPLRGVLAALQSLEEGESALFAPCDVPRLLPSGVALLLGTKAPAVAIDSDGSRHPLLCHLPGAWAPRVAAVLAAQGSAQEALEGAAAVCLPGAQLANWNRPPG